LSFDGRTLRVRDLRLDSSALSGRLDGDLEGLDGGELALRAVRGEFTYVPDVLGAWLAPYLPGELSGSEPEQLELSYDGPLASFALEDLLASGEGRSHLGLGTFSAFGIEASGGVTLELDGGRLTLGGDLSANGGALTLAANYGDTGADLVLRLDGARAGAQLAPLLGRLHPAFAGLDQLEGAGLDGLLVAELELKVDGPVSLARLNGGFDLARISGRGSIALDQASLRGSPFLSELLGALGEPAQTALDLAPMNFTIDGGRLAYAERWRWAIDGVETWFGGSLAPDGGLDLMWELPITEALARKHSVLEGLVGTGLKVPLRGTLAVPKLDWNAAFKGLAGQALEAKVKQELGLDSLLGGGGAEALLTEADRLWAEGRKWKASRIYIELRKDHRLTATYLLNRKRIDERRRYNPK
jgi:hypothetical protein